MGEIFRGNGGIWVDEIFRGNSMGEILKFRVNGGIGVGEIFRGSRGIGRMRFI